MKGVILAAGYGTRFLPVTKTIPKEMFPLVDTPAIDLIVREFIDAGLKDILIVTSRRKKALEDYFDREVELENTLEQEGKFATKKLITPHDVNFFFFRQKHMSGTGDALLQVEPFVGSSPFVVAYPDDILIEGPSLAAEMIELYNNTGSTVLAGLEVPEGDISRFGVMDTFEEGGVEHVRSMVEKPPTGQEPSRVIGIGRYLYTPELFQALRESKPSAEAKGEFTQTDAINTMASRDHVVVHRVQGKLLDVGTPKGYLKATIEFGLGREDLREDLLEFLAEIVEREKGR